jgi:hypothetical protein
MPLGCKATTHTKQRSKKAKSFPLNILSEKEKSFTPSADFEVMMSYVATSTDELSLCV